MIDERRSFFETAMRPGFPDRFSVLARRTTEDGGTLSAEAVENLAYAAHDYLMASLLRRWKETGEPPQSVRMNLSLDWRDGRSADQLAAQEDFPWHQLDDEFGGTLLPIDGQIKDEMLRRFLDDRKENGDDA